MDGFKAVYKCIKSGRYPGKFALMSDVVGSEVQGVVERRQRVVPCGMNEVSAAGGLVPCAFNQSSVELKLPDVGPVMRCTRGVEEGDGCGLCGGLVIHYAELLVHGVLPDIVHDAAESIALVYS
jgi:hypothetical protein